MKDENQDDEQDSQAPETFVQPRSKLIVTFMMTFMMIFLITTIICAVGWYNAYNPLAENGIYKNFTGLWGNEGTVYSERWNVNGNRATVWLDLNYDYNFEKHSLYNISDQLICEEFDDNEDGVVERTLRYSPDGKVRYEYLDKDANGWYERMLSYGRTITIEYKDSDFDCEYDSIYVYENNLLINSLTVGEMGKFFKTQPSDSTILKMER